MKKRLLTYLLIFVMAMSLIACGDEEYAETVAEYVPSGEMGEWSIYWYLCGSDLETNGGCATYDLQEMLEVELPEGVNIVIQTGGAYEWQNDLVDSERIQRYVYNREGLFLVDEQESANMGKAETLADFLAYASENFPAEKTGVVFWNHGGGSVTGAAFDELYDFDSLKLDEMYAAFSAVFDVDPVEQPLEFVGFDTCLMATVDVAYTFSDIAHYLVGSEEVEPGNGWNYTGWIGALAENPTMNGAELGQVICDAYFEGCEMYGTEAATTLSVTDLTKIEPLLTSYDMFGAEALAAACEDPGFFSEFARAAAMSENYGGNTKEQGYTNMVDLGHLARTTIDTLSSARAVLDALEECVLYKVNGPYRAESTGLSCYYSYSADVDDFMDYAEVGTGNAFKYYFEYGLTGEPSEEGLEYIKHMQFEEPQEVASLPAMDWDGADLDLDDEGTASLNLGPEANEILAGIGFSLYYVDEENDLMMLLGTDNDIVADWENGIFYDNFRGVWGSIDGCLVYMELSFEGEDYNLYSVPVLLNEEEYNLQVAYDFVTEEWYVYGATQGIDENGMADKEVRQIEAGDEITTIWYLATYSGEDEFEPYSVDTITVTEETVFAESELPDGTYMMLFAMWDAFGNYAYSDAVDFECVDGEIYTTVYE